MKMPRWSKRPIYGALFIAGLIYLFGPLGLVIYFGVTLAQHLHVGGLAAALDHTVLLFTARHSGDFWGMLAQHLHVGGFVIRFLKKLVGFVVIAPLFLFWMFVVVDKPGFTKKIGRRIAKWYYTQYGEELGLFGDEHFDQLADEDTFLPVQVEYSPVGPLCSRCGRPIKRGRSALLFSVDERGIGHPVGPCCRKRGERLQGR